MSHSVSSVSLRSQALDKSILHHLFLPYNLPSSADADYLIEHNYQNEYQLLEYMHEFFKSLDDKLTLPIFSTLMSCIQRWLVIQNPKNHSVANLQLTIEQLAPGDFLPLYFQAQNAAIFIEIDGNSSHQPLISSWEVLLPTDTVTSSVEPHLSCFPVPTFRLSNRTVLTSRVQCEIMMEFLTTTIEYSQSYKATYAFDEIRDVPIAHYVCHWWMMHLQGTKIDDNSSSSLKFTKKHRDHIRWNKMMKPFRRSGLWMTMKVVLHTILTKRLGSIGRIVYKLLITSFLTHTISTRHISADLLMYGIRKIARLLNKIEVLLSTIDAAGINVWIRSVEEDIKRTIDRIFPNVDRIKSMDMHEKPNNLWLSLQRELDHARIYQHSCDDLKAYLETDHSTQSPNYLRANVSNDATPPDINQVDYIPSIEALQNRYQYSIEIVLARLEIWVASRLEQWFNRPTSSSFEENRFEGLFHFFEKYQSVALAHYCPTTDSADSIGYSRFILTSLTTIYVMHQKLCHDERFVRLDSHNIAIPNLLNLFEYLILPFREDMIRARHLYDFFREYNQKARPGLFTDIQLPKAYGVYFAGRSESMNESLRQIQAQVERDKESKRQEVNEAKQKYHQLMDQANLLECECDTFRCGRTCQRCSVIEQAQAILVQIYECPIPAGRDGALAVVFELQMPTEIRCYRDILWQFINRPHPQPETKMYEWLKVRPHADKLKPYYYGPVNCRVKLVSSTESITQTHYSIPPSIASTPVEAFLCENGLNIQISSTEPIKFEDECRLLTPQLTDPNYQHLQFAINNTTFLQNHVIAELSNCPSRMKRAQHVEFGSFRSGHRLQWWNLLTVLEMESLAIDEESVVILIAHSLWQYGPVTENVKSLTCFWCPQSHQQLLEDHFVDELILRLNRRLAECEFNWQNELVLVVIVIITMRILAICNSTRVNEVTSLVLRCRQVGERWIELLSESIQTVSATDFDHARVLRDKISSIAVACLFTFAVDFDRINCMLSTNEHVIFFLKMSTTVHDNMILNKNQNNMSVFMKGMMQMCQRMIVKIQPSLNELITTTSYQSLNEFSVIYWAVIGSQGTTDITWRKRNNDFYDGWYDGKYQSIVISIDCIRGTFLINGMTVRFLPSEIISDPLFARVFENHIFEVQATGSHNTYITKHAYHGHGNVRYRFQLNDGSSSVKIYERHIQTGETFELISHTYLAKELPDAFVDKYSHWRNTKTQQIFFRPVHFKDSDFLDNQPYVLTINTGFITTNGASSEQILINRSSEFFQKLFRQYFSRLDDEAYVYMLRENASHLLHSSCVLSPNAIVHIYLSRLGIAFIYDTQRRIITSREYSDMCISEDQWVGALTGLQSGLLLSPFSTSSNRKQELHQCRKLIVPFGKICPKQESSNGDYTITIQRSPPIPFLHQYFVFILNDRLRILQSTNSPTGWLYLALLHAMTSRVLPDEYTGMTGMERSFQLLNSAGSWTDQPFDDLSLNILCQIASISPKASYYPEHLTNMEHIKWNFNALPYSIQHFGYYLIAKKLFTTSHQLNFMYPSLVASEMPKLFECKAFDEKLLTKLYWDYRDSYNPTARLSPKMEAEIRRSTSTKPYQPINFTCSYQTNYNSIRLIESLYERGTVNLKDSTELSCFPLSKWLSDQYQLENTWIGLLKFIDQLKTRNVHDRQIEIARFEILLDFLHYISTKCSIQPFYLQMLKSILNISLGSITYPKFIQYENIEDITVCSRSITFPRKLGSSKHPTALEEIKGCFASNATYQNSSFPERGIDKLAINGLLRSWRLNSELREFLERIQNQFHTVTIVALNTKIPFAAQHFVVEQFQSHYQIRLRSTDRPIDRELLQSAEKKFLFPHSDYFIKPTKVDQVNMQARAFPEPIFPSIDHRINPVSEIANHFKNRLSESWKKFQSCTEHQKKYPSMKEIKQFLRTARKQSLQCWNELARSIRLSNELISDSGLMLRILPTTLISNFERSLLNEGEEQRDTSNLSLSLTTEQCTLLGGIMVSWVVEQQLERALHFASRKKREDFEKEMSNIPHVNWTPALHIPWLILELEMNITIREIQIEVARHMMQPNMSDSSTVRNIVMQMNMGEGKTSVILPMLALGLSSSSSSLVRIIVLKSLFPMNYQSLRYKLGALLNRRVLPFACRRDMNFTDVQVKQIFDRLKQGLTNLDIVLTAPEDILSFDLLTIDKCRRNEFDTGRLMLSVQRWSKTFVRDILDESDEILHVKYQLIYTVGGQQQIDGGSERWTTIQLILNLVKNHAANTAQQYDKDVSFKMSKHQSRFPRFRLLSNQPFPFLCEKIADDWLSQKHFRQVDHKMIRAFILETGASIDSLIDRFSHNDIQLLLILRGLLSSEVLLVALKKRHRVNFGVNQSLSFNRLVAVPFRAKDVAADKTEFGHVDVAIVLTQLSYYYSGLNDLQIIECFNRLIDEERDPKSIYDQWISIEDKDQIHASIHQWKSVNVKDYQQRTRYLFPTLRCNMLVIDYFLNHFVYPREAKQFPHKLVSSAWDLSSSLRSKIITGFSGTNDTQLLLPVHIRQDDLPELRKTDAVVVNNLLHRKNENYQSLSTNATTSDILGEIIGYKSIIQVILDVGALFIDGTNREVAVKWLKMSNPNKIDYAVYLELDSVVVCDRQFHHHSFVTSPASERLDRCVVYLDEIHTRGTDFKFPKGFQAAVTLGSGLTKDRLVQACMRMRKLGHGHSLSFWSSNEVHQQMQMLKKGSQREERNVSVIDILRWVYENTQQATWDGFHHWATQSLSFQRKVVAFRKIHWQNPEQMFQDSMMQELARDCLEPEIIELKRMYGAPKKLQTVSDIYLARYPHLDILASVEHIHNIVLKQLTKYSGSKTRLAQLLDEEQERELEQELEEERQHICPPTVSPCDPILHKEIKRLCDTDTNKMDLNHLPSVFFPLAHAFTNTTFVQVCQPNSWSQNLWISSEFQRVIETKGESLDPFLRPPRWVVIYQNEDIIFVSAFEANWLMDRLRLNRSSNATTLRLLLPRTKQNQSIFINTPTLIIPPSIVSTTNSFVNTIPVRRLVELFVFNGTLYFDSTEEQEAYCELLGICPKPRTSLQADAFEKGWIATDGHVAKPKYRVLLNVSQCRFTSSPMTLVRILVENRNQSHAPIISHVGSIISNGIRLLYPFCL